MSCRGQAGPGESARSGSSKVPVDFDRYRSQHAPGGPVPFDHYADRMDGERESFETGNWALVVVAGCVFVFLAGCWQVGSWAVSLSRWVFFR